MTATNGQRSAGTGRARSRRWGWLGVAVVLAVAVIAAGAWLVRVEHPLAYRLGLLRVDIPAPDLSSADTQLAKDVQRAMAVVAQDPRSPEAWLDYGMLLDANNFMDFAVPAYREAARRAPDDIRPRYHMAIILQAQGRLDEALALYREILPREPNYPPLFVRLGDALAASGQAAEAQQAYEQALAVDSEYPLAHRNLGQLWLAQGNVAAALPELERVVALTDGQADAATFTALAQVYRQLGRADDAEKAAAQTQTKAVLSNRDSFRLPVQRLRPELRMARVRAELYIKVGKYDEAAEALLLLVAVYPDDADLLLTLSQVYEQAGKPALATFYRQRAERAFAGSAAAPAGPAVAAPTP